MPLANGVYYPVITPFTETYEVDTDALRELIEFGIEGGIDGVFALGSSGQGPAMELPQRKRALEVILDAVGSRIPVVAHVGTPVAASSLELARHAEAAGADTIALLPPYFYSDHSESEIIAHYEKVADEVDLDIMIYNNPKYAGTDLTPTRVKELVRRVPSVTGIKASFTTASTLLDYEDRTPDDFDVFAGSVGLLFPTRYHGVSGSIHPPSSPFPEVATAYWDAIEEERVRDAVNYQRLLHDVSSVIGEYVGEYGRSVYASLFRLRGIDIERYPLWEQKAVPRSVEAELESALRELGVLQEGAEITQE